MTDSQFWQAIAALIAAYAALFAGMYVVVTKPIQAQLADIVTLLGRIEAKLDGIEAKLDGIEAKLED